MPKEYTRARQTPGDKDDTALRVGWSREAEYVQVAVVKLDTAPDGDNSTPHLQLDRAGINAAIRTLRRARDAAFGRDE